MSDAVILVFGHTRPRALGYVLEGLRRQEALAMTQVWLDGHQDHAHLVPKVQACRNLELEYKASKWIKYGSRCGHAKLLIDALRTALLTHNKIIVLQDDCFPAPGAIAQLLDQVEKVRDDAGCFSVYGHHFGGPDEGPTTTAFQHWGWASTASKITPILHDFWRIWAMAEPDSVQWFRENMTDDIRARMNVYPGRADTSCLERRFSVDAALAFLIARAGMINRKTPEQVVFNFGIGANSGHFTRADPAYLKPPYNMMPERDLRRKFDLRGDRWTPGVLKKILGNRA
jgi:hypothetical protein